MCICVVGTFSTGPSVRLAHNEVIYNVVCYVDGFFLFGIFFFGADWRVVKYKFIMTSVFKKTK